jgi:hypothetical protein
MLTNEQCAQDIALIMAQSANKYNAGQYASGKDVPVIPVIDLYFDAYAQVLPQMEWKCPKDNS